MTNMLPAGLSPRRRGGVVLIAALCASCGGDVAAPPPAGPQLPASVEINADSVTLRSLGESVPLQAVARDSANAPIAGITVDWTSTDPAVISVSTTGRVTATGDGTARVVAATGALRDTVVVAVSRTAATLIINRPAVNLVSPGDTAGLLATVHDARGHLIGGLVPDWSSTDTAVATVSPAGVVTAVAAGSAGIRASLTGVVRLAQVSVLGTTGSGVRALDLAVAGHLARLSVPGAALAVAHQGRLVHARGYGLADTLARVQFQPTSISRIASVSKSITAVGIMSLVDAGIVSLDDRVFVRWLADLLPPGGPADPRLLDVTVRQLLQHTGGWNQPPGDPMFQPQLIAAWAGVPSPPGAETIIRYVATQPLQFNPGTQRYYSNVGYVMLGRVIERATGTPYTTWVRNQMLGPRGVTSIALAGSLAAQRAAGEVAYYTGGAERGVFQSVFAAQPGGVPFPYGAFAIEPLDAGGGLMASATDLVRFLLAADGQPVGGPDDLITPASRAFLGADPGLPGNLGNYGSGWFRIGQVWYHLGRLPGMMSAVVMDDARGIVFALLLNYSEPTAAFQNDVANSMLAAVQAIAAWPAHDLFPDYP